MVIGFDGSRAFKEERTGTENYSYQLLKALAKIDRRNTYIIYLRPLSNLGNLGDLGKQKNFLFKTINFPRLWTQIGLAAQTFKDNLDVLFIPAHTSPLIHKPNLKTVVTVHDLGAEYLPKMHQLKQELYLKYITRYQLRSATKLIAVSNATKMDLIKKVGIDPKKVGVVYEGYDSKEFRVRSSEFRDDTQSNILKHYELITNNYLLFVGTIQPRKNLERIIIAISHQPSAIRLAIAGSKGWQAEEIYKLPKKLGIEDRVKFLGYVPDKDMPALYSGALALIFPSLFEGFGLPILEAQASGCPVLTSNISSMPEVAGKGAIFVDPYSVDDIVVGLKKMEDRRLRMEMIKKGFENIKRFSWEKCARETLRVLEQVTNNK